MPHHEQHDQQLIQQAAGNPDWGAADASEELKLSVARCMAGLNDGSLRVAERASDGQWQTHAWIKQAVSLYFKLHADQPIDGGCQQYFDRVPLKYADFSAADWQQAKVRAVPGASVRYASYIAPGCVLMPCFINIGAHVGGGCMIDTWATVGACAQIGKRVHLSGGAGIGGVLEPAQANPTIIEDDCFIGARSEIVEGVVVESGAVISMGVFIGQSTPIYDREADSISYGRVPQDAVVIAGSLPSANAKYARYAAIIVKRADAKTRAKVGLNALLRIDD